MSIVKRIKTLADSRSLTFAELERKLDFSNGQIRRWEKSNPGIDKIEKIADYFNVSTDYLLGREKTDRVAEVAPEYRALQRLNKNLSEKDREKALKILKATFEIEDDEEDDI